MVYVPARRLPVLLSGLVICCVLGACGSTVTTYSGAATALGAPAELGGDGLTAPVSGDGPGPASAAGGPAQPAGAGTSGAATIVGGRGSASSTPSSEGVGAAAAGGAPGAGAGGSSATGAVNGAPITIGVLAAGSFAEAAAAAGADAGTSTSGDATMKAVLKYYEERGGIAGRRVRAVVSTLSPTTGNYDAALAAECARFTQDNDVAVVLSNIGYYKDSFEGCLHAKRKPHVEGGWGLTDEADLRRFPGYYLPSMPSYDARFAALLVSGIQSGQLPRGTRVGVVVEDCPPIQRAYAAEWQPRARQAGLIVDEFHVKCTSGAEDAGRLAQDMQAAQLRFRSNDVATVMFATYPTEVNVVFFAQSAEAQRWYPKYYLDSKSRVGHEQTTGNYPAAQVKNMRGVGWTNAFDVSQPSLTAPAQLRCLDIMKQDGIHIQNGLDAALAFSACDPFFLLEASLVASRGASDYDALQRAIESLGTSFAAAGNDAATTLSPHQHYGTTQYATFAFEASCGCVRYTSSFKSWR